MHAWLASLRLLVHDGLLICSLSIVVAPGRRRVHLVRSTPLVQPLNHFLPLVQGLRAQLDTMRALVRLSDLAIEQLQVTLLCQVLQIDVDALARRFQLLLRSRQVFEELVLLLRGAEPLRMHTTLALEEAVLLLSDAIHFFFTSVLEEHHVSEEGLWGADLGRQLCAPL